MCSNESMPNGAWLIGLDCWSVDRCLMESLWLLSSSETARGAAAAWLLTFDAARAAGFAAEEASAIASRAPPVWAAASLEPACELEPAGCSSPSPRVVRL